MKVVSLFSGAGGLDLGYSLAGHEVVWANEINIDATNTYRFNLGEHIVCSDIRDVKSNKIPSCDIVVAGFPCQGFSFANTKRSEKDSRNFLYRELLRVVKNKKPKYFQAENVKGLVTFANGKWIKMIVNEFAELGYDVKYKVLNSADFGVPQKRERVIIIGQKKGVRGSIEFPEPTHFDPKTPRGRKAPWVTTHVALKNYPEPELGRNIPNHDYSKYKLRFNGYLGNRWVDPNKPAPTVTGRGDFKGGVVVLHHPKNHRRMSARELATIQSFPDDFVFQGTLSSCYVQIANAVPPLLARAVASQFS